MKVKTLTYGLLTLTIGCASTQIKPPITQFSDISIPELNRPAIAYLGEKLLTQATGYYAQTITLGGMNAYAASIKEGTYYNIPNTNKYRSNKPNSIILNNGYGKPIASQDWVEYDSKKNEVCVIWGNCYDSNKVTILYNKKPEFVIKDNSFQQVIEYSGKSGQTLKFTYRELSKGMVRQAFTSEFEMDLNEGDVIGYKGAQLKIKSANNNMISYSIIKNFNE